MDPRSTASAQPSACAGSCHSERFKASRPSVTSPYSSQDAGGGSQFAGARAVPRRLFHHRRVGMVSSGIVWMSTNAAAPPITTHNNTLFHSMGRVLYGIVSGRSPGVHSQASLRCREECTCRVRCSTIVAV